MLAYNMPNDLCNKFIPSLIKSLILVSGTLEAKEDRRGDKFSGGGPGSLNGNGGGGMSSGQGNPNISHSFDADSRMIPRSEFDSKKFLKTDKNPLQKKETQKYRLEVPVAMSKTSNDKKLIGGKPIGVAVDIDNVHPSMKNCRSQFN